MVFDKPLIGDNLPGWPLLGGALCLSIAFHIFFAGKRRKRKFIHKQFAGTGYNGGYYGNPRAAGYDAPGGGDPGNDGVGTGQTYSGSATSFAHGADGLDGNFVRAEASFSNTIKYINSEDLKRAELECSFASMDVYFDNARIAGGNAAIVVDVSFGALNLYVPKEWRISVSVGGGFANTEEKNIPGPNVIRTADVIILGDVSFGGLTITYV
jgi:hypothetical protein